MRKKENKEGEDGKITITVQTWNPGEGEMMDQIIAEFVPGLTTPPT